MFERFTDQARRVVVLSQEEARLLNHNYIGTEHLLLGLLHEGEGIAAQALEALGVSLEVVRAQVEAIIGLGASSPSGHIPFTPRAKKVLENALREALQLGHNSIGPEHILLGLIRERRGVAAQVLAKLGMDLDAFRVHLVGIIDSEESGVQPTTARPDIQPASSTYQTLLRCSFCDQPQDQVAKLIAGPGVYICDRCIALCQEILDEEPPPSSSETTPPSS